MVMASNLLRELQLEEQRPKRSVTLWVDKLTYERLDAECQFVGVSMSKLTERLYKQTVKDLEASFDAGKLHLGIDTEQA